MRLYISNIKNNQKLMYIIMKQITLLILILINFSVFAQKTQETRRFNAPEKVIVDGKMQINFHLAEDVEVVIESNKVPLKDIYTKYTNEELLIRVEPLDIEGGKVVIDAYLPKFSSLTMSRGAETDIRNDIFKDVVYLTATSGAELETKLSVKSAEAKCTSGAFIELAGKAEYLEAKAHSGGKIRTDSLALKRARLIARTGGFIAATPTEEAQVRSTFGGEIKLLKKAIIKSTTLFGEIYLYE